MRTKISLVILMVLEGILIFSLGFISSIITSQNSFAEFPLSTNSYEKASPSDYVQEKNILVYKDKVVILLDNPSLSKYADTNSMLPVLDAGANGIKVVPQDEKDIKIGDIISFEYEGKIVVHRVVNIGQDSKGTYFITQGDNNQYQDQKIRFKNIKSKTIAIIY